MLSTSSKVVEETTSTLANNTEKNHGSEVGGSTDRPNETPASHREIELLEKQAELIAKNCELEKEVVCLKEQVHRLHTKASNAEQEIVSCKEPYLY